MMEAFEPCMMYHPKLGAKYVKTQDEALQLSGNGWTKQYIHQPYPTVMKHPTKGKKTVHSAEEHAALGEGWGPVGYEPTEFATEEEEPERREPRPRARK